MEKIKSFFKDKTNIKNILFFIGIPILDNLIIEMLSRSSFIKGIIYMLTNPIQFLCNAMIIMITIGVALFVRRRVFVASIISIVWILLGLTNMVMLHQRVTPFNASDLKLLDIASTMIKKYFNVFSIAFVIGGLVVLALIVLIIFIKGPKVTYKINYWKNLIVLGIMLAVTTIFVNISLDLGFLSMHFTNLTSSYEKYGFVYCFGNGLFNTGVKKPSDYSKDTIDQILGEISTEDLNNTQDNPEDKKQEATDTPNIIFLQLESFFDLNKVKDLTFSSDPTPYFNSLKQQYSSGYLNVFNIGYGTCNTEFEIMTGMNLDDFGPGEIPYKTVLKSTTCESTAYDLKEYGYSTHAIHDNDATFYSRKTVFKNLGFDTFTSKEYMNIEENTPMGWAKDKYLTQEILKCINSTDEPDYIYTISVQGHGSYPTTDDAYENPEILVSGLSDSGRLNAIQYYANELHEMDKFIQELTTALSNIDEDTILVMYGDHLPGLGFSASDLENNDLNQTEYIIWNNMGLPVVNEDIETYQLSAKILSMLNMDEGVINKYHQTHKDSEEYLNGLQNLEYDILYGDRLAYGGINPFSPTELKMGIDEIDLTNVEVKQVEGKNIIYLHGKNFNDYSKVFVNGDKYSTELIDSNTLSIEYDDIKSLDSFVVSQVDSDSGYVISSTKECLYYAE